MRKTALLAAAVSAAALGFAPAPALAARAPAPGHGRVCNETYDWEAGVTSNAAWAQADWETNTCSQQLQVRVHCATRFGYTPEYSGKVKAVELNDRATCPSNEALKQIAIHFSSDGGITWTSYQQLWP